jgi:threonine dehydratase
VARRNVPAQLYVPETAPAKVTLPQKHGAEVVQSGGRNPEATEVAVKHAAEVKAMFCHPYEQSEVCAGQGALGLELLKQIGGIAGAIESEANVVALKSETAHALNVALAAGQPVESPASSVLVHDADIAAACQLP